MIFDRIKIGVICSLLLCGCNRFAREGEFTLSCRENVNVLRVYERFKEKGFAVVGYSLDSSEKSWQNAVKQDSLPWVQLSGLGVVCVDVAKLYGVSAIPSNFLIDPDGKILAVDLRGEELEKALEQVLESRER